MGQTERLYRLKQWLDAGRVLKKDFLLRELEISPATLKRDLAHVRDRLGGPLVWDRDHGGWRWEPDARSAGAQYELPGLWFTAEEIQALLTMQHLLANLDSGGLLTPHIEPLMQRLAKILGTGTPQKADIARRIRVQTVGARRVHLPHFQLLGAALLRRRRLRIEYHGRSRDHLSDREVSPQRLIHYRENWYLDAWCHWRRALRSFSVDAVRAVQLLDRDAIEIPDAELDATLGAGYGIFAGRQLQWALLRFSPERARWVAAETWHPKQRARWDDTGGYLMELPFADARELEMDILRHVPEVQVIGPPALKQSIAEKLRSGLASLDKQTASIPPSGSRGEPHASQDADRP